MTAIAASLPTGRQGRVLALGILIGLIALAWIAAASPLIAWYGMRAETLQQRRTLEQHMARIAATVPALHKAAGAAAQSGIPAGAILAGATDAIAGAALQERIQTMAREAGVEIASAETLRADQAGPYRRIGMHVTFTGQWPQVVDLLAALGQSTPRMVVTEAQLHGPPGFVRNLPTVPIEASLTIVAFASPEPAARPAGHSP